MKYGLIRYHMCNGIQQFKTSGIGLGHYTTVVNLEEKDVIVGTAIEFKFCLPDFGNQSSQLLQTSEFHRIIGVYKTRVERQTRCTC
jgi:hypothetical protein